MKTHLSTVLAGLLCIGLVSAYAQPGRRAGGMGMGGPPGPRFDGSMAKLFGENSDFSANVETRANTGPQEGDMTIPGKIAFSQGKSRMEMDMGEMKGGRMSPQSLGQMKSMGMDKMIMISRPDKKVNYTIYPGMQAYVENAMTDPGQTEAPEDLKVATTELGKETVDGHPCIKNKAIVTNKEGEKHEAIIWNATDLKKFPIKMEQQEQGNTMTMLFKDIKLSKPDAGLFEPPSGFTKYASMPEMMREVMMKRFGAGPGGPAGPPPPTPPSGQ